MPTAVTSIFPLPSITYVPVPTFRPHKCWRHGLVIATKLLYAAAGHGQYWDE